MASATPEPRRPRRGRPKGRFRYSKRVIRRADDTRCLRASIEVFKADVAAGMGKRLASELAAGETLPDHALSLDLVGRCVQRALDRLKDCERGYLGAQVDCASVRRKCDKLARGEVHHQVKSVRRQIDAQFGRQAGFEIHRMKGKTLRKPRRLHVQASALVDALKAGGVPLPEPVLEGQSLEGQSLEGQSGDRGVWLGMVEPGFDRLTDLLTELLHRELEIEQARDERNEALAAFDAVYGDGLHLVQATCGFAGMSGVLKSLRSYVQRRLLSRRARDKRQARAEGRLGKTRAVLRSVKSSLASLLGRRVA